MDEDEEEHSRYILMLTLLWVELEVLLHRYTYMLPFDVLSFLWLDVEWKWKWEWFNRYTSDEWIMMIITRFQWSTYSIITQMSMSFLVLFSLRSSCPDTHELRWAFWTLPAFVSHEFCVAWIEFFHRDFLRNFSSSSRISISSSNNNKSIQSRLLPVEYILPIILATLVERDYIRWQFSLDDLHALITNLPIMPHLKWWFPVVLPIVVEELVRWISPVSLRQVSRTRNSSFLILNERSNFSTSKSFNAWVKSPSVVAGGTNCPCVTVEIIFAASRNCW